MATTWSAALGWRLRRHFLEGRRASSVEAVVDRLVALPSWLGDARTAVGLRLTHPDADTVDDALAQGRVVCAYAFRGSMQLMSPASAAAHLTVRAAGRQWERTSWRTHYRLEPQDWPRLRAVVRDAVRERPLTQPELAAAVARDPAYRHLRAALDDSAQTLLKPFCWQGDLGLVPSAGPLRFRLLESVAGWPGLLDLDEAGPYAVRAYLRAYGPATRAHLHHWLADGLSAGRRRLDGWIDGLAGDLTALSVDGDEALCLTADATSVADARASDGVVLLPGHDQWVLGPGTSDTAVVPAAHRQVATRGANLVVVGGRVAGTWRVADGTLALAWFDGARPVDRTALAAAADRLGAARGAELRLAD